MTFGKRGSGKTTLIRGNLENCKAPVVVLDILGNFDENSVPDAIHAKDPSEAILLIKDYVSKTPEDRKEMFKIFVVQCPDPNLAIDYLSAALWEARGGTLVIDEADAFSESEAPCFDQLIRYGRNRGVDILTGVRRPAEIGRNLTAGANRFFIFQTQEPRDIEYWGKTALGRQRSEILMKLPDFHGVFLDYDRKVFGKFKIDPEGQIFKLEEEPL